MKVFNGKGIIHKIAVSIIVFIILFNFIIPNVSFADGEFGGTLFTPLRDLFLAIPDVAMWIINKTVYKMDETFGEYQIVKEGKLRRGSGKRKAITKKKITQTIKWPDFPVTPEEIFSNKVPLLDVNFFNPPENTTIYNDNDYNINIEKGNLIEPQIQIEEQTIKKDAKKALENWLEENASSDTELNLYTDGEDENGNQRYIAYASWDDGSYIYEVEFKAVEKLASFGSATTTFYGTEYKYERIETKTPIEGAGTELKASSMQLQPIISKWYYALRNFSIVMILSVLVYIGIRIIISSSSEDRAKYKQHLLDWLVAICLLFFMHYIMSFAVTLTEEITKALDGSLNTAYEITLGDQEEGIPVNLMENVRIELQLDQGSEDKNLMAGFSFTVIYLGLVMYTILFLFRYLKRLLMLTFLTIIAPLMAMTYPLDKMHDNNAQGFNSWLKEYIFNLLIQPVHLVLYTVLIGTAIEFATDNILYSLVAFGFILQAEKIMKKFFGFDKANTVSNTSAALGGALAMKGVDMLSKHLGKANKSNKDKEEEEKNKLAQANRKPTKDVNELMNSALGPGKSESGDSSEDDDGSRENSNNSRNGNASNNGAGSNGGSQVNNLGAPLTAVASRQAQIIAEAQKNSQNRINSTRSRAIANRVSNSKVGKHAKYIGTKAVKGLAKGALKAGLMAAGATVGLTAGLVSDDFSNVTKYGLAGAGAGWIAGKGIPNKLSSMKEGISKAYEEEYKATHTKAEINERLDRKVLDDKERIKKYQEEFGVDKQGAQNIMREIAQQYRDYGVTDDDMIIKAIKTDGINDAEKIMVAKMASQVGGDEKKYKNLKQGLEDRGIDPAIANKYLKIIRGFNNWV